MSHVFGFSGDSELFLGGTMYPNPKDSSLFLSPGHHMGVYFPPSKRSRVNAPFVFSGGRFVQKQPSIEVLPDECLFEIFRRLSGALEKSACACVSKRWLTLLSSIRVDEICSVKGDVKPVESEVVTVVQKPSEFVGLKEDGPVDVDPSVIAEDGLMVDDGHLSRCLEGKKATDVRLAAIAVGTASRGGLGKLSIRGSNASRGVTDVGLKAIARGCPSLRFLSLWNLSAVSDEGLISIANECHGLEKLDLCKCPAITDKALLAIAQNCPKLTSLAIESCANIGNSSLEAVARFCPNLKSITIKNCARVGDNGIVSLFSKAGNVLTKARLESLNISDGSLAVIGHCGSALCDLALVNLQNVNERGFWVMGNCRGLLHLRSILVTACPGLTDVGLEAVAKGSPCLKRVSLQKCAVVSDNGLISLAKAATSIEILQLDECNRVSPAGFLALLLKCGGKMKSLSVANCLGFKDLPFGLDYNLAPCSSLQSLCIHNCPGFGNGCLAVLAKLCPNLKHVKLTGLRDVTDEGIIPLVENSETGFVEVNLNGCMHLTDKVTSAIAKHHGGTLEVLNLDGCKDMTDSSLFAISDNCCLLNELDVSNTKITDRGVSALAEAVQLSLGILSLSGCLGVSNRSLASLKKLGQTLTGLDIKNCRGISSYVVSFLTEFLFRCDILS